MHLSHIPILIIISFSLSGSAELPSPLGWIYHGWQLFSGGKPTEPNAKVHAKSINHEIPCGVYKGKYSNRVVGGVPAAIGEFPWVVSLQVGTKSGYRHACGGSILDSASVLTAAHCVQDAHPSQLRIVAGEYDLNKVEGHEQMRNIRRVMTDGFNMQNFSRDMALLQLSEPLELNANYVAPICLPQGQETFVDTMVVAGWGRIKEGGLLPSTLQKAALPLLNKTECDSAYRGTPFTKYRTECQLCTSSAMGKDACQGDSGGPLMCYNANDEKIYICGIVSWGVGCAEPQYPGSYTQVDCYTEWIMNLINK